MVIPSARPQAPEPVSVEIPHIRGATQGVVWPWTASDLSLLVLHDFGSDLDSLRWFGERVASAGTHVLAIDLPGSGLSGGDLSADGPDALVAAYRWLTDSVTGAVGFVAHGRSAQLLLTNDIGEPPVAVAFLDPQRDEIGPPQMAACWRHVPKLVILSKGASEGYAQEIIAGTTAWCLRADLVGLGEGSTDREGFEIHVVSLALKFMLEQAAFELASRRSADLARPMAPSEKEN